MRFDDSLQTVLAADSSTPVGATLAWRQLVDLVGRGRVPANGETLTRLRELRREVPRDIRAASGRALAFAAPPAALVRLFAEDDAAIAAPVLRTAAIAPGEWNALLADLGPGGRSILRHRRDLPAETMQALQAFGAVDFVLPEPVLEDGDTRRAPVEEGGSQDISVVADQPAFNADIEAERNIGPVLPSSVVAEPAAAVEPTPTPPASTPDEHFVRVGAVTHKIPGLAELLAAPPSAAEALADVPPVPAAESPAERFEISELVARIDAFQRQERPLPPLRQAELFDLAAPLARRFRFESDADGVIRWIEGTDRGALIGLPLAQPAAFGQSGVDGAVAGAFRRRAAFADARLVVIGRSSAGGQWRISATPAFDAASGRFTGYRGVARRPRREESAEAAPQPVTTQTAQAMRQLVHELRTPLNAISGFAEMIEAELLGPVATDYRNHAAAIRGHADRLLSGIDDLDLAARAESGALDLRPEPIAMAPLLRRIAADLHPLADLRGATVTIDAADDLAVLADAPAVERLVGRLFAVLIGAAGRDEVIVLQGRREHAQIVLRIDRPLALGAAAGAAEDGEEPAPGVSLLGADFALRLAANLAREQGGALVVADDALTLRLPAVVIPAMEQASIR